MNDDYIPPEDLPPLTEDEIRELICEFSSEINHMKEFILCQISSQQDTIEDILVTDMELDASQKINDLYKELKVFRQALLIRLSSCEECLFFLRDHFKKKEIKDFFKKFDSNQMLEWTIEFKNNSRSIQKLMTGTQENDT